METFSFKEIGDTLYNKLLEIKDTRIGAVYNHDVKIEDGINLPAIIINPSSGNIDYLDSCSYEENINYTIRVIDRIQDGIALVEDNIRVVADVVVQKLKEIGDIHRTSNKGQTFSCSFSYQWGFTDTQEPLRAFIVECNFKAITK